jgi:hypothetical protein
MRITKSPKIHNFEFANRKEGFQSGPRLFLGVPYEKMELLDGFASPKAWNG